MENKVAEHSRWSNEHGMKNDQELVAQARPNVEDQLLTYFLAGLHQKI